jgi:hypothetical protein
MLFEYNFSNSLGKNKSKISSSGRNNRSVV